MMLFPTFGIGWLSSGCRGGKVWILTGPISQVTNAVQVRAPQFLIGTAAPPQLRTTTSAVTPPQQRSFTFGFRINSNRPGGRRHREAISF